jgi:predicted membrane channel-forming protein YqfA (hemolysin III family)
LTRKVDSEGQVDEPIITPGTDSGMVGPLLIEIPLWRLGRVKLESHNSKTSLSLFILLGLFAVMIVLTLFEATLGTQPGLASLLEKIGEALLLVVGVLIGSYGNKSEA